MSRHVSDARLDVIHAQLSGAIRKQGAVWIDVRGVPIVPGHDLICLLDELRRRRQGDGRMGAFRLGKLAKILMALKVGETVQVEPVTQGALSSARHTARRHMGVPDAAWWTRTLDDGLVEIRRAPDGAPPHAKYHNAAVHVLAAMAPGDETILTTLRGRMHNQVKIHARRIMDDSEANWRCWNLASGNVKCMRTR